MRLFSLALAFVRTRSPHPESLTVYLIFLNGDSDETMMAKLPPLPSLLHLRFLELRNVEANELGIALRHLGPLSSVISLTVSGNVRDMRTIVRTLEETLDGSSAGTLRCLRRLELEREGPPPLSMGPERDELQLALVSLQKSLAARSIAVTSRCLD